MDEKMIGDYLHSLGINAPENHAKKAVENGYTLGMIKNIKDYEDFSIFCSAAGIAVGWKMRLQDDLKIQKPTLPTVDGQESDVQVFRGTIKSLVEYVDKLEFINVLMKPQPEDPNNDDNK